MSPMSIVGLFVIVGVIAVVIWSSRNSVDDAHEEDSRARWDSNPGHED